MFEALAIVPNINQLEVRAEITIEELTKILWESIELTQAYIRKTIENNYWNKAGTTIVVAAVMGDDVAIVNWVICLYFIIKLVAVNCNKLLKIIRSSRVWKFRGL